MPLLHHEQYHHQITRSHRRGSAIGITGLSILLLMLAIIFIFFLQ